MLAAVGGHADVVLLLLEAGANLDMQDKVRGVERAPGMRAMAID